MRDVIEVSYTGDLLAHRRCARAWVYEKHVGLHPYEQVQAMEGRLVHHAMEWMARRYLEDGRHVANDDLKVQLEKQFKVLWARGFRTSFSSKAETLNRIVNNLYCKSDLDPTVRAVVEGAQHSEYELRTVRKLIEADFGGKSKLLLTGVLDVVVQQQAPLTYRQEWHWVNRTILEGDPISSAIAAHPGDLEIWDFKATRFRTPYKSDYVRQLLTYAALYRDQTGRLPERCVLFFVNEQEPAERLLSIALDDELLQLAVAWTLDEVRRLRQTVLTFQRRPQDVRGGTSDNKSRAGEGPIDDEQAHQCTACGQRFDCAEYHEYLGGPTEADVKRSNVFKN